MVLDALHSPNSKIAYDHALTGFLEWYRKDAPGEAFSKAVVQRWLAAQSNLSASTINLRLSAVKKLAAEALDNGLLNPTLAHGISRVKGIKRAGVRVGNWLSKGNALHSNILFHHPAGRAVPISLPASAIGRATCVLLGDSTI